MLNCLARKADTVNEYVAHCLLPAGSLAGCRDLSVRGWNTVDTMQSIRLGHAVLNHPEHAFIHPQKQLFNVQLLYFYTFFCRPFYCYNVIPCR